MATIHQILSARNLTGVIQGVRSGIPTRVPDAFLTPTRNVSGKVIEWHEVNGTRQVARIVQYGSPAQRREQLGITQRSATALHTFEKQAFNAAALLNLLDPNNATRQQLGMAEVTRQTAEFKRLFSNLRIAAVQMALMTGTIYFDNDGNLLPSSSGAAVSIDFNVPSGNKGQLNVFGDGAIIDAKWDTASTAIIKHLNKIKKAALKKTGYELKHAFYGSNIPGYLAKNTEAKEYLHRNPQANQNFLNTGEIPPGLAGLTWHPMDDSFYADKDGTLQTMLAADNIVFTPDASPDWYELVQGSYAVPMGMGLVSNGQDATTLLNQLQEVAGMFSYAAGTIDPPAIEQYAGDTFLPLIKVPGAMFIADVDF